MYRKCLEFNFLMQMFLQDVKSLFEIICSVCATFLPNNLNGWFLTLIFTEKIYILLP